MAPICFGRFAAGEHNMAGRRALLRRRAPRDRSDRSHAAGTDVLFIRRRPVQTSTRRPNLAKRLAARDAGRPGIASGASRSPRPSRKDYKTAREEIGKSAKGPFSSLTVALVDAWASAGQGDETTATADLKSLRGQAAADSLDGISSRRCCSIIWGTPRLQIQRTAKR